MAEDCAEAMRHVASKQYGVVAAHQTRRLGSRAEARTEFESIRWHLVLPGVYQLAGAPESADSVAMSRLLRAGPGSAVSHRSALELWEIVSGPMDPLHTLRMRGANGLDLRGDGIVRHESRKLPPHHLAMHRGFLVTTPSRTLADLAGTLHAGRLERLLDRAWFMGIVGFASLTTVREDLNKRGRRGISILAKLTIERGATYVPPASGLESRLNRILDRADLPSVARQQNIGGEEWLGRVDFRLVDTPIVIEAQSDTFHASLSSAADDERRFEAFAEAGFYPVPISQSLIWDQPAEVVARVEAVLRFLREPGAASAKAALGSVASGAATVVGGWGSR